MSERGNGPGIPARVVDAAIRGYQLLLRPVLPRSCRYAPSCSQYLRDAVGTHGAAVGIGLGIRRILRCHPWARGGWDPVSGPGR